MERSRRRGDQRLIHVGPQTVFFHCYAAQTAFTFTVPSYITLAISGGQRIFEFDERDEAAEFPGDRPRPCLRVSDRTDAGWLRVSMMLIGAATPVHGFARRVPNPPPGDSWPAGSVVLPHDRLRPLPFQRKDQPLQKLEFAVKRSDDLSNFHTFCFAWNPIPRFLWKVLLQK